MLAHLFKIELTQIECCLLITNTIRKVLFVHFVNLAKLQKKNWLIAWGPKLG